MSFSGSIDNFPQPKQNLFGVDASRTSTNESTIPVPWFTGLARMGTKWLGQAFNTRTVPITEDTKKQDIEIGREYYIGCAGLVCLGPVDVLNKILFDNQVVWEGQLWRSGDVSSVAIDGYGVMRFYWGTETQTIDATLATLKNATDPNPTEIHGAYRGQCYFVFDELFLGDNRTSAPQIEFILGRYPSPDWIADEVNVFGDINASAAIADLVENPFYGLGLLDKIDTTSAITAGQRLTSECFGISPVVDRQEKADKTLTSIIETIGGFWQPTNDGKLGIKLRRSESTAGIPALSERDFIESPKFETFRMPEPNSEIRVVYQDRELNLNKSMVSEFDPGWRLTGSDPNPGTLRREMVTRQVVARGLASIAISELGRPLPKGSVTIRKSSLGTLDLGDLFRLNYPHSHVCQQLCRVTGITHGDPAEPRIQLRFAFEREEGIGIHHGPEISTPPTQVKLTPVAGSNQRIIELSKQPKEPSHAFMALVERPSSATTGAYIWQLIDGSYTRVGQFSKFAQRATLDQEFKWTGDIFDPTEMSLTLQGVDTTLETPAEFSTLNVMALIGDELVALYGSSLVGSGQYTVKAVRGRLGTTPATHASVAEVWIFRTNTDATWDNLTQETTQTFKIQPFIKHGIPVDLADVDPIEVPYTAKADRPYPPADLQVNGQKESAIYHTGSDILVEWTCQDATTVGFFDRWPERTWACPQGVVHILDQFYTVTFETVVDGEALSISNAVLQDALGSEPEFFFIRVYQRDGYLNSFNHKTIRVDKG